MKFKVFLWFIILTFILNMPSQAQHFAIKGSIYDLQNHRPLAGASVVSLTTKTQSISNNSGNFIINTHAKRGKLRISVIGYKTKIVHFQDTIQRLHVLLEPDFHTLTEVKVSAIGGNKSNKDMAGSIAILTQEKIQQGDGVSLQPALNSIPGVQMKQSTLSESNVSIRGNGVRSPWGIRDIKIYLNNIPLTETDGTTRLEALNISDLGRAEIIKGPVSSIYGSGIGGVMKFWLARSPYQEKSMELSGLAGSDGLSRTALTYRSGGDKFNSFISYGRQHYDGYRAHSKDDREFISANFQIFPSDKQFITVLLSRSSQKAQIPGALTTEQVKEDRKQANQSNLEKVAGRKQNWTRIGLSQQYQFNNQWSNSSSIFTYTYDLNHPLPYAYIRNFYQSYGGRTKFDFHPHFDLLPTTFTVGGEFNQGLTKGTLYVNDHGKEGNIIGNTDYKNTLFSLFLEAETQIGKLFTLEAGLSYNGLTYHATDYLHPEQGGVKKFKPRLAPRIAIGHDFGKSLSLHASISSGYTAPTTTEIKNADQTINKNVQAEKGINYEMNAKGSLLHSKFDYNLSFFLMEMEGELIGQAVDQGITIYHNSGETTHQGIELALSYQVINENNHKAITKLYPFLAVTYSDFTFKNYKVLNSDNHVAASYNGNQLTGIEPWRISAGIVLETRNGFYGNLHYFFHDQYPLNDANTDFNDAYSLLNAKVGYKKRLATHFGIDVYAGVNNLTNRLYSSYTAINATFQNGTSPAYFNPSASRNGYVGIRLKYFLKSKNTKQ